MSDQYSVTIRRSAFDFLRSLGNADGLLLIELFGGIHHRSSDFSEVRSDGIIIYSAIFGEYVVDYYHDESSQQIRIENIGYADDPHDIEAPE